MNDKPTATNEEILFELIIRVRDMEKKLKKANSKIRKLEKALDYEKIAVYTNKYLGKKAKRTIRHHDINWSDLEKYLGLYSSHTP